MTSQHLYRLIHDLYLFMQGLEFRLLASLGLSLPQFRLLELLNPEAGITLTSLSEGLFCSRSTASRLVESLEVARLVYRVDDPEDRRINRVFLSPRGAAVRQEALDLIATTFDKHLQILSPDEQATFEALFQRLRNSFEEKFKEG